MSAIRVSSVSVLSLLFAATALSAQTAAPAPQKMSRVRIVRLSEVRGAVQMDRRTGQGFEPAIANLPVVEQTVLRTEAGVAEVEFEDNSTLRLAPNSTVAFPIMERAPSGATVSEAQLLSGTAYVSMVKDSGNGMTLLFGSPNKLEKLQLGPGSHIRLETTASEGTIAVLGGTAHLTGPGGEMDVAAKHTATLSLAADSSPEVAKKIAPETLDSWDKQATDYHARVATLGAFNNSPYAYGMNDLSYYGAFTNTGGCGTMWRPYFASAAWDPYANGTWAYYPGNGYSWVSPYPWGWTPYHYGSWSFCPGSGWGWMPGGMWNGLNNVPSNTGVDGSVPAGNNPGFKILPHPPVHPPQRGLPTLMEVNTKPPVTSTMAERNSFVFRRDSAGLGVPREGLGKLNGFSHSTLQRGMASTQVYLTAGPAPGMAGGRSAMAGSNLAPVMIHRGAPPMAPRTMSADGGMSGRGGLGGSNAGLSSAASSAPTPSAGPVYTGGGNMGGGGGARMGGGNAPSAPSGAAGGARPH
jgi:hypothetical protein